MLATRTPWTVIKYDFSTFSPINGKICAERLGREKENFTKVFFLLEKVEWFDKIWRKIQNESSENRTAVLSPQKSGKIENFTQFSGHTVFVIGLPNDGWKIKKLIRMGMIAQGEGKNQLSRNFDIRAIINVFSTQNLISPAKKGGNQ